MISFSIPDVDDSDLLRIMEFRDCSKSCRLGDALLGSQEVLNMYPGDAVDSLEKGPVE